MYAIGNGIKGVFSPLGFGSWQATVSLISGVIAKEGIAQSLSYLSCGNAYGYFDGIYSVYAYATFILLSPPCISALSVAYGEIKSKKTYLLFISLHFAVAYIAAFAVNLTGRLIGNDLRLIFIVASAIIIVAASFKAALKRIKRGLKGCSACTGACTSACGSSCKKGGKV